MTVQSQAQIDFFLLLIRIEIFKTFLDFTLTKRVRYSATKFHSGCLHVEMSSFEIAYYEVFVLQFIFDGQSLFCSCGHKQTRR